MRLIEFVDRQTALHNAESLKDVAFAIAKANNTLPGYSSAPECIAYCNLMTLGQLRDDERCIFIDGTQQNLLTNFKLENGNYVIGPFCVEAGTQAEYKDGVLSLIYPDGIVERFRFDANLKCWQYFSSQSLN